MKLVMLPVYAQSTFNNLCRHTLFPPEHKGAAAPEEYSVFVPRCNGVLFLIGKMAQQRSLRCKPNWPYNLASIYEKLLSTEACHKIKFIGQFHCFVVFQQHNCCGIWNMKKSILLVNQKHA